MGLFNFEIDMDKVYLALTNFTDYLDIVLFIIAICMYIYWRTLLTGHKLNKVHKMIVFTYATSYLIAFIWGLLNILYNIREREGKLNTELIVINLY
jgi:cell shape-determining protein MreD